MPARLIYGWGVHGVFQAHQVEDYGLACLAICIISLTLMPAGANERAVVSVGLAFPLRRKEMEVFAVADVVSHGLVAALELHIPSLTLAAVEEYAFGPAVRITVAIAGVAGEEKDERMRSAGGYAALAGAAKSVMDILAARIELADVEQHQGLAPG